MKLYRTKHPRLLRAGVLPVMIMLLLIAGMAASAPAASGHGEEVKAKGWVATDWYRVMNFSALAILLFLVLRKPIPKALNARIQGIRDQLAELESRKAEAERQLAAYNAKLSELEKEAEKIVQDYVKQGNEAKARILKEAEATAEKIQTQARRAIEHEFGQAKSKLQAEILEQSIQKAEAILKSRISASDQDKLIDEYLEKVVAQ